jgi:fibronectin-binding autotransporter adhesin
MVGQGNPGEPGSIVSDVLNNSSLVFNRVEDLTYAGTISGSGAVTKLAAGKLTLTGANPYSLATSVNAGTLIVANTTGSATGTSPVTVLPGATLAGTGTLAGAVSITGGGHLAPGMSAGNLTVGSLSLVSGSALDYELGAAGTGDRTTITSPAGLSLTGGTVNITGLAGFGVGQYPLLDYTGSFIGAPTNLGIGSAPTGYTYSFVNNATNTSIDLVVAVPESSSILLVVCFGWLPFFHRRHRS